jgi:hypothetical protein
MPWTEITRAHYVREGLRYASDLSDAELGDRRGLFAGAICGRSSRAKSNCAR